MAQNVKLGRVQLQQMPRLIPAAARRGAGQQPAASRVLWRAVHGKINFNFMLKLF